MLVDCLVVIVVLVVVAFFGTIIFYVVTVGGGIIYLIVRAIKRVVDRRIWARSLETLTDEQISSQLPSLRKDATDAGMALGMSTQQHNEVTDRINDAKKRIKLAEKLLNRRLSEGEKE